MAIQALERPVFSPSENLRQDLDSLIREGYRYDVAVDLILESLERRSKRAILEYFKPIALDCGANRSSLLNSERLDRAGRADALVLQAESAAAETTAEEMTLLKERRRQVKGDLRDHGYLIWNGNRIPFPEVTREDLESFCQWHNLKARRHGALNRSGQQLLALFRRHKDAKTIGDIPGWEEEVDLSLFQHGEG